MPQWVMAFDRDEIYEFFLEEAGGLGQFDRDMVTDYLAVELSHCWMLADGTGAQEAPAVVIFERLAKRARRVCADQDVCNCDVCLELMRCELRRIRRAAA